MSVSCVQHPPYLKTYLLCCCGTGCGDLRTAYIFPVLSTGAGTGAGMFSDCDCDCGCLSPAIAIHVASSGGEEGEEPRLLPRSLRIRGGRALLLPELLTLSDSFSL